MTTLYTQLHIPSIYFVHFVEQIADIFVKRFLVNIVRIELKLKYVGIYKNWMLLNVQKRNEKEVTYEKQKAKKFHIYEHRMYTSFSRCIFF